MKEFIIGLIVGIILMGIMWAKEFIDNLYLCDEQINLLQRLHKYRETTRETIREEARE